MPSAPNVSVAFEPVPIDVEVCGHRVVIPAVPASVWLSILADPEPDGVEIFPGLLSDKDQDLVDGLIFDGRLGFQDLQQIIFDIIGEAAGHDWWWALHLIGALRGQSATQLLGEMVTVDATKVSLGCWLNRLYALLVRDRKMEDRMKLDGELEMPPAGIELTISEADERATQQTFFQLMGNG